MYLGKTGVKVSDYPPVSDYLRVIWNLFQATPCCSYYLCFNLTNVFHHPASS